MVAFDKFPTSQIWPLGPWRTIEHPIMTACDLLLTNATVLTMDERFTVHRGERRRDRGRLDRRGRARRATRTHAADTIDCGGRVVMPGLVNAHTHVPMTLLRGLADDLRLDVWLMGYMMPVEREFVSPDFVRLGTRLGCAEMIRSGVTCFADMYYFEEAVAEATADGRHARAVRRRRCCAFPRRTRRATRTRSRARASSSSAGTAIR